MKSVVLVVGMLIALFALTDQSFSQTKNRHKIGWLQLQNGMHAPERLKSLVERLHELGQIEGKTFDLEPRFADGDSSMLRPLAEDLVRAGVDVIVATSQPALDAAYGVTRTVPIVARMSDNPVKRGMARALISPEGNVTGFFSQFEEMASVRLTELNRAVPGLSKVGVLMTVSHEDSSYWLTQARGTAAKLGLDLYVMNVNKATDLETVFTRAIEHGVGGFVAFRSPTIANFDQRVIELSKSHRLPGIFDFRDYAELGAFMSYGPNANTVFRELAPYVARILKGETPGMLAIGQPRVFELVINLRAAKSFGFIVPSEVVTSANLILE